MDVSIVCLDIVGYSRLVSENEAFAVEAVIECRDLIVELSSEYNGMVFSMAGDGFMLKFERPDNAMQFAMALQKELSEKNKALAPSRQIWMRAGIEVGKAVAVDEQLYGDTVNIAARFQETSASGGIVLSAAVLERLRTPIEHPIKALGELQFKNIASPVSAFEVSFRNPEQSTLEFIGSNRGTIASHVFEKRPAIAVLPFEFDNDERGLEYVSEGIFEDLITGLSHVRQFPVISKASCLAVVEKSSDPSVISQQLGVRYIITGQVRGLSDYVHTRFRLIDAESGQLIWAEKFGMPLSELIESVDLLITQVVGNITTRLEGAEGARARTKRRSKASVNDLVWRARWHFNRLGEADLAEGRRLLDEALAIDPENSEAIIQLAFWHHLDVWKAQKSEEDISKNLRIAHRAILADEYDSRGYLAAALAEILLKNFDRALVHCEHAIKLNPSYAHAYAEIGTCKLYKGQLRESIEPFETCLKLSPQDYYVFNILAQMSQVYCMLGDWSESLRFARRSSNLRPNFWLARLCEVTSLERNGELRSAAHACALLLKLVPDFGRNQIEWLPFTSSEWVDYFDQSFIRARLEADRAGLIKSKDGNAELESVT